MDIEKLKRAHRDNEAVKAICGHMAAREKNQTETKTSRLLQLLENDHANIGRSALIAGFRLLEEVGCGKYVEGRRGWPSRFVWSVKSRLVQLAAQGERSLDEDTTDTDTDSTDDLVEHSFYLRPGILTTIELPEDLSWQEAKRLAQFIKAIPMESNE